MAQALKGRQQPRIVHRPNPRLTSRGPEMVEFARSYGLELDEWQQRVLIDGCRVRRGKWASFEVGLCVGRQNGKNEVLVARELYALYEERVGLIIHSAHLYDTSIEHFQRLFSYVDNSDELSRKLKRRPTWTHGMEGFQLTTGERMRFRTRSRGGGRGFSGDLLVFDEVMFLPRFAHGALVPIVSARPNPQMWYAGSAVDQEVHEHGLVFAGMRERALEGKDKSLAYFEWSAPYDTPPQVPDEAAVDPRAWAQANPALGVRITTGYLASEQEALDRRSFAVERLGVGDWPDLSVTSEQVISWERWQALEDERSKLENPVTLAFDVSPERRASIAAAGKRADGLFHVEIAESRSGTRWLVPRLLELMRHEPVRVVCDSYGPAASILRAAEEAGLQVEALTSVEHARACGQLLDLVGDQRLRHLGSSELAAALKGAKTRPLGDAWAWSRKNSQVDISPLVAATLALWAAAAPAEREPEILVAVA
jgi:hypothetical protein